MIPNEKLFSLPSFQASKNFFIYEDRLDIFDPVITKMVSERYHASAYHKDEDSEEDLDSDSDLDGEKDSISASDSESDEDCFSDTEEQDQDQAIESAVMENSHCGLVFGSFSCSSNSDLEMIHTAPKIPIEPVSNGFTIKIGEITCFLVADGDSFVADVALFDPEVKVKEKLHKIEEETLNHTVLSEIAISAIDHHHDDIGFIIGDLLRNAKIIASSKFSDAFFASDLVPSCLDSENRVTVESDFVFSDLHDAGINVFDPGGASTGTVFIIESHIWLIDHHGVWIVIFDPGGNRNQPSSISLRVTISRLCVLAHRPWMKVPEALAHSFSSTSFCSLRVSFCTLVLLQKLPEHAHSSLESESGPSWAWVASVLVQDIKQWTSTE